MPTCPNCQHDLTEAELREARCSACGNSLQIPADAEQTVVRDQNGQPADSSSGSDSETIAESRPEPPLDDAKTLPEVPQEGVSTLYQIRKETGAAPEQPDTVSHQKTQQLPKASADSETGLDVAGDPQRTVASEVIDGDSARSREREAEESPDKTILLTESADDAGDSASDSADSASDALDKTLIGETWIDDSLSSPKAPSETWDEDDVGKTMPDGAVELDAPELPKTIDAGVVPEAVAQTVQDAWPEDLRDDTNPGMTIKTKGVRVTESRATLVIKPRAVGTCDSNHLAEPAERELEYELLHVLGEGGMGIVWDAHQTSIDRSVAVKMIKDDRRDDQDQRQKFLAEAVVTGDLDHPNIVPIYDVGSNQRGSLFYSMKKVQGTPWQDVVQEKSLSENIEILLKTADAVAFAHSRGVIHRDLKPENVMLGEFGEVLVMDWGLAQSTTQFRKAASISQATTMGGTPAYMAPEMATGPLDRIGPHSDIYLLGAILFQIVTGKPPHTGKNVMKCLMAAARNLIQPTDKTGELVDIAFKAMATDPKDRHADVLAFQAAIRDYQSHSESVVLSNRAEEDLVQARVTDDYQDYAKALFAFEEALAIWSGNKRAQSGVPEAQRAYAQSALEKGDFDLGLSLLDEHRPEHREVYDRLKAAQAERDARVHRLRTMKRIGAAMAALFVIVVSGFSFWVNAERTEAVHQKNRAEEQRQIAEKNETEAKHQETIARQNETEAKRQEQIAQDNAQEARKQQTIAEKNAREAKRQEQIAKDNEQKAIAAKEAEEYEAYIARIGLASAKIRENSFDQAAELLDRCIPREPDARDLRDWEWGRLMHLCSQSERTFAAGAPLDALAVSADERLVMLGGWNGTAQIWDVASGKQLQTLAHGGLGVFVYAVAFSPDGRMVATGSNQSDGFIKLWDVQTGKRIPRSFRGDGDDRFAREHTDAVVSVSFSKDGRRILTGSFDGTARLWDVATGKQLHRYLGHTWWVWSAAFSPDETQLVTASQDGTAIVWETETETPGNPFTGHQGPIYSAAFSPDGQYVVSGGYDRRVLIWRPDEVEPYRFENAGTDLPIAPPAKYRALDGHTGAVRSVAFSQRGELVLSAGHDNTIKVWDFETGRAIKTFRGHASWVRACAFGPDGRTVLSASHDASAKLWSIADYEEIRVLRGRLLEGHQDAILDVAYAPDGHSIVTASRDRTARTWDVQSGRTIREFAEGHTFLASTAAFFPNGKTLVTGAVDNTVRIWDVASGTELERLEHTGREAALAVSHDGRWLATGSDDTKVKLWDMTESLDGSTNRTRAPKLVLSGHHGGVTAIAFSPDDSLLLTGDARGRCILWNCQTGESVHVLRSHTRKIVDAAFLPDGTRVLTASGDNTVGQWDVSTGTERLDLILKHPDAVEAMALFSNGQRALTSCVDGSLRVWNVATAKVDRVLTKSSQSINNLAVSRDSRRALAVTAESRTVHLWDLAAGRELQYPAGNDRLEPFLNLERRGGLVWSAVFSPDARGASVVTVGGSGARLWSTQNAEETMTFTPHGAVASAAFSPDGLRLVTGSWDNSAKIWNVPSGHAELKLEGGHTGAVNSAVFSPDGKWVLTASDDRTACLWDADSGKLVRTFQGHAGRVWHAVFSPDGTRILTTSSDKTARIWDTATARQLVQMTGHAWDVLCGEFSKDGSRVVTGSEDNSARIWDAKTGKVLHILQGHTAPVTSVAFSPDGQRVVTASQDTSVKLWDAAMAKEILTLDGHAREVTSVAFSPDGRYIVSGSRDGRAIIWLANDWHNH